MATFNKNFYTPNTEATIEQAMDRLNELGYSNYTYKSMSRANGASFYFNLEDGKEIRVSDHRLTGNRAFDIIQVDLYEIKTVTTSKTKVVERKGFVLTDEMIERARLRKEELRKGNFI